MIVTPQLKTGNSSKFRVITKRGEYVIALSYTLRVKIWKLADEKAELSAAHELAEAIVSRHDPELPFKPLYIFAEHTSKPSLEQEVATLRTQGFKG